MIISANMKTLIFWGAACLAFIVVSCQKTPEAPKGSNKIIIGTTNSDSITQHTVKLTTQITNLGGNSIQQHGFCWGTTSQPDISGSHSSLGTLMSAASFSGEASNLNPATLYYMRPYLSYAGGILYGQEIQVTTSQLSVPVVNTDSVYDVTASSVIVKVTISNDGGSNVSRRGVCWNLTGNPSLSNCLGSTENGSGTGTFTASVTTLSEKTTYFIAGYATTAIGTGYGSAMQFTTPKVFVCGDNVLYGGKNYPTVSIGSQCWFAQNLDIGTRIPGAVDQTNNGIIEKYCYEDKESNCSVYGGLYLWDEAMQFVGQQAARGICPVGWHIPRDDEWTVLTDFLGGDTIAGGKLKEADTLHWTPPNLGATNSSGFTALPGGYRYSNLTFGNMHNDGSFWSSTKSSSGYAYSRDMFFNGKDVYRNEDMDYKTRGVSLRCLRNDTK